MVALIRRYLDAAFVDGGHRSVDIGSGLLDCFEVEGEGYQKRQLSPSRMDRTLYFAAPLGAESVYRNDFAWRHDLYETADDPVREALASCSSCR